MTEVPGGYAACDPEPGGHNPVAPYGGVQTVPVAARMIASPERSGGDSGSSLAMEPRAMTAMSDDSAPAAEVACVLGFDGELKQVDDGWHDWLGVQPDDAAPSSYIDLVHPADRAETLRLTTLLVAGKVEAADVESRLRRQDGTYGRLRWHLTVDRRDRVLYCVGRAVSDRRAG